MVNTRRIKKCFGTVEFDWWAGWIESAHPWVWVPKRVAKGDDFFVTFYEVNDVRCYYLEVVGKGWRVGERSRLPASEWEHVYLLDDWVLCV